MPCYFAFLNCLAAQACFMWARLLKCVIASYDRCTGALLLDFSQQIWIMLKWAVNWQGYANMSQMAVWGADGGDMQTVYGRGSVWQVHHSVIKGHIITYNKACMTIAGKKKKCSSSESSLLCPSVSLGFFLFFLFFLFLANPFSAADAAELCCVRGFVSTLFKHQ